MTHLNDISKVYLEEVAKKKEDNSYLETNFKKRQENNKKAIADMKKVKDDTVPRWMKEGKKLDPVGQEDADIDNDGDEDETDKYLHKKRKAIGKAISKKKGEDEEDEEELAPYMEAKNVHGEVEVPSGDLKSLVKKAVSRIDTDVDGDVEHNDKHKGEYGEFIPTPDGKGKVFTGPKKVTKESFSNWRNDLREVMGEDDEEQMQVKEKKKKVNNTININPKLSEGVTILEMVEISEEQEIQTLSHAVDFFFEEGINEDGLEMIIEELGLEEFVDLVYEVGYETLSEAYALTSKKKTPKRLPKGTAPAKTTKATISRGDRKIKAVSPSGAFKRRPAAAKAVETAKQEQPKKKPVRDAIARGIFRAVDAYKAGMERHKKAMGAAKETGKTIAKAAKVTHEAGRRAGQTQVGQAVKKAGAAAIRAGVEKAKKDIKSLKKEELELQEKPFDVYDTRNDVYLARGLKTRKGARRRADRADTEYGAITTKVIPTGDDRPEVKYKTKKEELELQEKSLSISQQQAAGAALAAKRGEIDPSELKGASIQMYKSMTEKELRDFAKTKHKGLPKKKEVEEEVDSTMSPKHISLLKKRAKTDQEIAKEKLKGLTTEQQKKTEVIDERRREDKGKPRPAEPSPAFKAVSKMMGSARLGVEPRGEKKVPGQKPPAAGEFGGPKSPSQKVAQRRAAAKRAKEFMSDTRGT
jgi:hypothetical protein